MESTEFLVVGCGPAGGTAAREAARSGVATVVLERDAVVGAKRVCAAGLRPGFCTEFDLPRSIVHLDPPRLTLSTIKKTYAFTLGPAHTTTREELDGTIASLAAREGADIRTSTLFRSLERDGNGVVVEYADTKAGTRKKIRAQAVFLAQGSTARLDDVDPAFAYDQWKSGLLTCIQYRVYPATPAIAETYETLEMHYYRSPLSGETLIAWTERAGMPASLLGRPEVEAPTSPWRLALGRWGGTAASGLALLAAVVVPYFGGPGWLARALYGLSVVAGGVELFPKAVRGLRSLRLDIHVLMGLAVLGALALGQWDEAATVSFLFGLSEALEGLSLDRARRAVRALLEVTPQTAEIVEADGSARQVPADRVARGDRVRVRSGERIPVDGTVVVGRSSVDQKAITGESVPVLREPGDGVFAGTVNGDGAIEVEASGPLGDALISRVIARVREAQAGKAPVERRLARFASWYTPLVVAAALAVMLAAPLTHLATGHPAAWLAWFSRGLVVLVIACPCALVIATPVAVVSALATAARHGVLVKGDSTLRKSVGSGSWPSTRPGLSLAASPPSSRSSLPAGGPTTTCCGSPPPWATVAATSSAAPSPDTPASAGSMSPRPTTTPPTPASAPRGR